MKKFLVRVDKVFVYDAYYIITPAPIEYDNITRYEAHKSTQEYFLNEPEYIPFLLSSKDMEMYVELVNTQMKDCDYIESEDFYAFLDYYQTAFIFEKYENKDGKHRLYMPKTFKKFFSTYTRSEENEIIDTFHNIIKGFVETHGVIKTDTVEEFFFQEYELNTKIYIDSIIFLRYKLELEGYLLIEGYMVHESIAERSKIITPYEEPDIKSFDYYLDMALYGMEKGIYESINETFETRMILSKVNRLIVSNLQFTATPIEDLIEYVENSITYECIGEYLINYPLWMYGGRTALEILMSSAVQTHKSRRKHIAEEVVNDLRTHVQHKTGLDFDTIELVKFIIENDSLLDSFFVEKLETMNYHDDTIYDYLEDMFVLEEAVILMTLKQMIHVESNGNYYTLSTDLIEYDEDSYVTGEVVSIPILPSEEQLYIIDNIKKLNKKIDYESLRQIVIKMDPHDFIDSIQKRNIKIQNKTLS